MEYIGGDWTFTEKLPNLETGQILYRNGFELGVNFTGIYIAKNKHTDGKCDIKALAFAFDTMDDYEKVLKCENQQYNSLDSADAPVLNIAEEEILYRISEVDFPKAKWPCIRQGYLSIDVHVKHKIEKRFIQCLLLDSHKDGVPIVLIEPLNEKDNMPFGNMNKRYLLLASHLEGNPLKTMKKRKFRE